MQDKALAAMTKPTTWSKRMVLVGNPRLSNLDDGSIRVRSAITWGTGERKEDYNWFVMLREIDGAFDDVYLGWAARGRGPYVFTFPKIIPSRSLDDSRETALGEDALDDTRSSGRIVRHPMPNLIHGVRTGDGSEITSRNLTVNFGVDELRAVALSGKETLREDLEKWKAVVGVYRKDIKFGSAVSEEIEIDLT